MSKNKIVKINENNIEENPQCICFINPKHPTFHLKVEWIKDQLKNGLVIKLLYGEDDKVKSMIEYIPGKYAWRAVEAEKYVFIHCISTGKKADRKKGLASSLIEEAEKDAKDAGLDGVAVITSNDSFMAEKELFIKNDFKVVEEKGDYQLLVKKFNESSENPRFKNNEYILKKYKELTILYSRQCPWVARFVEEDMHDVLKKYDLVPTIIEYKSPKGAQNSPSIYSVFNLVYDGKLLAEHYISATRFKNIVEKEITKSNGFGTSG